MERQPIISTQPRVTILMGVYNGAAFLPAQLASIAGQSHRNWHLICSDDGSDDHSVKILEHFARDHPERITLRIGPQRGFSANYMAMIAELDAEPGLVCFADQDDLWSPDKIARALDMMPSTHNHPTLYCGRHQLWFAERNRVQASAVARHPCGLKNALAENVASGNTFLLNPAAARLARQAARRTGPVFAHDWWLYLMISGCGGQVIFDNGPPRILYRQHAGNTIGAGRSLTAQMRRKIDVLKGEFLARIEGNLAALEAVDDLLTPDARAIMREFAAARRLNGIARIKALRRVGPYRQSWAGNLGFWGAASLGRV